MIFFKNSSVANPSGGVDWSGISDISNVVVGVVRYICVVVACELGIFRGESSGFGGSIEDGEQGQESCEFHFIFLICNKFMSPVMN